MEKKKCKALPVGTKYLSVVIEVLGQKFKLAAFKNDTKASDNSPDYIGKDIAIWIAEKLPPKDNSRGGLP